MFGIPSLILLLVLQAILAESQTKPDNEIYNHINASGNLQFPAVTAICFPNASAAHVEELAHKMCNTNESSQIQCQVTRYPVDGLLVDMTSSASDSQLEYCYWQLPDNVLCSEHQLNCKNCTQMPCIRQTCLHCEWTIKTFYDRKIVVLLLNITTTLDMLLDLEISWNDSESWNIPHKISNVAGQNVLRLVTKEIKLSYNTSSFIQDPSVTFITIVLLQSERLFISKDDLFNGSAIVVICLLLVTILSSCICCLKYRRQKVLSAPQTYKLTYRSEASAFSEEEKYAMLTRASRERTTTSLSDKQENEVSHASSMFLFNILSCLSPKRTVVNQLSEAPACNEMDDASIQDLLSKFDSLILTFERSNSSTDSSFPDGDTFPVTLIELVDGKYFCSEQLITNDGISTETSETKSSEEVYSCKSSDESVHSFFSVHPQHCNNSDMDSFASLSYEIDISNVEGTEQ